MLMCYEATRDLPTEEVEITTPITTDKFKVLAAASWRWCRSSARALAWWTGCWP